MALSLAPRGYIANHTSSQAYAFTGEEWGDFYDQNPDFPATDRQCQELDEYAEEHDLDLDEAWEEMQEKGGYEEEPETGEEWEEEAAAIEKKKEEEEGEEEEEKLTTASDSADRFRIGIDPKTGKFLPMVAVRVTGRESGTIDVAGKDVHIPPDTMVGVQKTPEGNIVVESSKPVGVDIPGPIDIKVSRVEISSSNGDIKVETDATYLGISIPQSWQDKLLGR